MAGYNSQNNESRHSFQDAQGQHVGQMMASLKDHTTAYRQAIPTLSGGPNPNYQNTWNSPPGYQSPYCVQSNVQHPYHAMAPQPPPQPVPYGRGNFAGHPYGMPGQPYGMPSHPFPPQAVYSQQPPVPDRAWSRPVDNSFSNQQHVQLRSYSSSQMRSPPKILVTERSGSLPAPISGEGNGVKARAQVFAAGGASFFPSAQSRRDPVNRAVVLLQCVHDSEEHLLRKCLHRMGFDEHNITFVHERHGIIKEEDAKRYIAPITFGLTPGSNLLLIACAHTYEGIELRPDFLTNDIYKHVAQFNNKEREQLKSVTRTGHQMTSDISRFEGVTLHAVLDGIKGSLLPYALKFEAETRPRSFGLKAVWKNVPRPEKNGREFHEKMEFGRVVQFCSDSMRCGHRPGDLLSAFICVNLEEAYLPYNVMTYRILDLLNHQFESWAPRLQSAQNRSSGARGFGEELVLLPLQAALLLYIEYRKNLSQKRMKEARDSMLAKGEALVTSASQFDPNLCADFCWRDETIPLSADLSGLSQCI